MDGWIDIEIKAKKLYNRSKIPIKDKNKIWVRTIKRILNECKVRFDSKRIDAIFNTRKDNSSRVLRNKYVHERNVDAAKEIVESIEIHLSNFEYFLTLF